MERTARRILAVVVALLACAGGLAAAFVADEAPASARYQPPPVPAGAVVFLGDSITRQEPWAAAFPGVRTSNQGVGGDQSADVLRRLDPVIAARPRAVFLLIGSNDVHARVPTRTTVARVERILRRLAAGTPSTALRLGTVLPRKPQHVAGIRRLNLALRALAGRLDVPFVDTYRHVDDGTGVLPRRLTDDGSHLTPAGKRLLADALRPHVEAVSR